MITEFMEEFNLLTSPLKGNNLIEASAGTGKTFAIASIFLRLLIEEDGGKPLTVREILVVTYTVAATEELRNRVRQKIRDGIDAFVRPGSDDDFLDDLVKSHPDPRKALDLLKAALNDFDEASICTIHGFCQRTLRENAFETMSPFDMAFIPDEKALKEEIVQDFWRHHFYEAIPEFVVYALEKKYSIASFLKLIQHRSQLQEIHIVPVAEPSALASMEPFRHAFGKMKAPWADSRSDVLEKLRDEGLKKSNGFYNDPERLLNDMDRYVRSTLPIPLFPNLERFTLSGLIAGVKKGKRPPGHPFFTLCEEFHQHLTRLAAEMEGQLLYLKAELFRTVRKELPIRKRRLQVQSYDDLLVNLQNAIESTEESEIAKELRTRYRAALIDEFQDTDPVQCAIFTTVFKSPGSILFLIGDPKQAIYSFRGADLFSYLSAYEQVERRYTLSKNWRSEPGLIQAINTVFEQGNRFLYDNITFKKVSIGEVKERKLAKFPENQTPFLDLWFLDGDRLKAMEAAGNKEMTKRIIAKAVAAEISRLIGLGREKRAFIGEKPLEEADIAVLVRDRYEARYTQDALTQLGIPGVLHSAGNIFDSYEALEMERILAGISEPASERYLRSALATTLLGMSGEKLELLKEDEQNWERWIARFREYNLTWERHGFMQMFRSLMMKECVRQRLLAFPDGERRLTNILHLSEILHTESLEQKSGMAGLLKWLSCQRDPETTRSEEHELQLESDANAVKIVTIHKSKGLEYPIVFCPFNWGGSRIENRARENGLLYHRWDDEKGQWQLNLSLDRIDSETLSAAEREILAENIRLLYVALTRAKHRCYVIWGKFKESETSSLAYTLHPPEKIESDDVVGAISKHLHSMTDDCIRCDLEAIAERSGGTIRITDMRVDQGIRLQSPPLMPEKLTGRVLSRKIDKSKSIASFSYFVAQRFAGDAFSADVIPELPDRDAGITALELDSDEEPVGMFAFPKGARSGTLLHDIFEHLDFTEENPEDTVTLVSRKLAEYHFDPTWQEAVSGMIRKVLATPLHPDIPGLSLSKIPRKERLHEMEFYFPLKRVTANTLKNLFSGKSGTGMDDFPERIGRLKFDIAQGVMKGFIDLLFQFEDRFYLLDWKSNFLGIRLDDYSDTLLKQVMKDEFYFLQYHLYIAALQQYLTMRVPRYDYNKNFGGVFYLFLRGVDPEKGPSCGIYYDRPDKERVEFICNALIDPTPGHIDPFL
jgi:exodeoxyribonuclease V beta subunit